MADRWYELGEKDKARTLFAASVRLRKDALGFRARLFPARLARVDLPAALAIAKELPARDRNDKIGFTGTSHFGWPGEKSRRSGARVETGSPTPEGLWLPASILWKMAAADPQASPATGGRVSAHSRFSSDLPVPGPGIEETRSGGRGRGNSQGYGRDRPFDRRGNRELGQYDRTPAHAAVDRANLTEPGPRIFLANRRHATSHREPEGACSMSRRLPYSRLAWYDRDVAAVLFQPVRALLDNADSADVPEMTSVSWPGRFSIPAPRRPGSTRYQSRPGLRQVTPGSELPSSRSSLRTTLAAGLELGDGIEVSAGPRFPIASRIVRRRDELVRLTGMLDEPYTCLAPVRRLPLLRCAA